MQINKNKYYSLSEIAKAKIVPGATSYPTLHADVLRDAAKPEKDRVINALIIGEGRGTAIRIKGSDLQNYIKHRHHAKRNKSSR